MMPTEGVSFVSADDPRVEVYRDVKGRDVAGRGDLFILEGENSIRNLVNHGRMPLVSVCLSERRVEPMRDLLAVVTAMGVPVYALEQAALEEIVGFNFHRGVLGCGRKLPGVSLDAFLEDVDGPLVLCEKVNNHDNVGSIFRNAAAFGAGAVLFDAQSSDPYYRKSVRVSGGHVLAVPFCRSGSIVDVVAAVKRRGYVVAALVTPHSDKRAPASIVDFRSTTRRVALLVGAEGPGLSQDAVDVADVAVTIPMVNCVDSINVATACAVALHEITNHRHHRRSLLFLVLGGVAATTLFLVARRRA